MVRILDASGQPIDAGRLSEPQTAQVGYLFNEWANHPARGLTPARLQAIFAAAERGDITALLDLADDMEERDGQIFSNLQTRKLALLGLDWGLTPPKGASTQEQAQAKQLEEWLQAVPDLEDTIGVAMDAVLKGFSAQEMVWQRQDGVMLPQFTAQPQRWFVPDPATRRQLLLRNTAAGVDQGVALKPFGWFLHVHRSRNGYFDRGALCRVLAFPYLFKNYATRDLAEFLEIYGLPLRVGQYPAGASDAEKLTLLRAVTQIGHNAAGIIPQGMKIDFQAAAQGTHVPFETMVRLMDDVQAKVIVGQTLTSGEGQHGTQALGNVHNEVRHDILRADARQVGAAITQQVVWPLLALNVPGADPRRCPRFEFDTAEPEDLAAYAQHLPELAERGLRIPVAWVHERLRIPQAEGDEPVLQRKAEPKPEPEPAPDQGQGKRQGKGQQGAQLKGAGGAGAAPPAGTPEDALDPLVNEALADWRPLLAPLVGPLLDEIDRFVAGGGALQALREQLPALVERMDSRALGAQLARAAFSARLAGEADLDIDDNAHA